MKTAHKAILFVALIIAIIVIAALVRAAFFTDDAPRLKPYKIAMVLRSQDNPGYIEMERAVRKQEVLLGINVVVRKVSQEADPQEQIDVLHRLANEDIDALIIDPVDSMAVLPVIKQYIAAGIPVINVGCRLDNASMIQFNMPQPPYVGINNEKAGYDVGKYMADRITEPTNVVLLIGTNSSMTSDDRKRGALQAFSENPYCVLKTSKITYWNKKQASVVTKQLLDNYEDIGAVFCVDDVIAAGAAEAFYTQTRRKNKVMISGFGDLKSAEELIQEGRMIVTVAERTGKQSVTAIDYAVEMLKGKKVPPLTYIDYALIDDRMLTER